MITDVRTAVIDGTFPSALVRVETDPEITGLGEAPGHGVDVDEGLAAKHPYERAYLPVDRLEDGTVWNW